MTEINNLDRDALFSQRNCHRRKDESRWRVTRKIRFLQFRPAIEPQRLENAFACHLLIDEIGNRTGEMTGDRQKSNPEFRFIGGRRVFRTEEMKIYCRVKKAD